MCFRCWELISLTRVNCMALQPQAPSWAYSYEKSWSQLFHLSLEGQVLQWCIFLSSSLYYNVQGLKEQWKTWPAFLRAAGKMPSEKSIQKSSATLGNSVHVWSFHFLMAMSQLCPSVSVAYIRVQMGSLPNFSPLLFSYPSFWVFLLNPSLTKPSKKYFCA